MQGKRTIESSGQQIVQSSKLGGEFVKTHKPSFIEQRVQFFNHIKEKLNKVLEAWEKPEITITLKDGKEIKGKAFVTTPYIIAKSISKNLAESSIVAKIKYSNRIDSPFGKGPISAQAEEQAKEEKNQYQLWDMSKPLEGDCLLELLNFDDQNGKEVFWHSSSHLLGQSLENLYGAWLCHGPPLEHGFFYDSFMGETSISPNDYQTIEKQIKKYIQEKQPFQRIVMTKAEALEMFAYNPFKVQLIKNKVPEDGLTSAYRCGNLIDLCTGPHVSSADKIKGFKITKNSSAYWLGKKENDDLQRVYGISYPKQSQLDEYLKQQAELLKRDHRTIGPKQGLFNFTVKAPGCAMFFPHGTVIYNRLIELMRSEYKIRGYSEVLSPNIYSSELWKESGHYFKYKENIFFIQDNDEEHGLKPMNCPGHCVMFDMIQRSYRDLPIRMADFGVLHRNELKGALTGLTRVRRFQQDDAHIFCRTDQIQAEILGVLDLLDYIYSLFGFKYQVQLSTRPQKFLGNIEDWNFAEEQLKLGLAKFGQVYKINQGDGAFYGPKIDIKLFDVFGREHQCGTVQLDFQLPIRFNLQYRTNLVQGSKISEGSKLSEHGEEEDERSSTGKREKVHIHLTPEQIEQRKKERAERKAQEQQKAEKQEKAEKAKKEKPAEKKIEEKVKVEEVKVQKPEEKHQETLQQMEARYNVVKPLKNGFTRPVIIHRAIFGSLERFIAILCEHTGGKWDFWLSPRQLQLIYMNSDCVQFTEQVYNTLLLKDYSVSIDHTSDGLNKKIRNAQLQSFNFIGVIGNQQVKSGTVNLRKRDEDKEMGKFSVTEIINMFEALKPPKSRKREELEKLGLKV